MNFIKYEGLNTSKILIRNTLGTEYAIIYRYIYIYHRVL